jgi:hypothetical protein
MRTRLLWITLLATGCSSLDNIPGVRRTHQDRWRQVTEDYERAEAAAMRRADGGTMADTSLSGTFDVEASASGTTTAAAPTGTRPKTNPYATAHR